MLESRVKIPAGGKLPYWPWNPPNLLFSAYRGSFPGGRAAEFVQFSSPSFAEVEIEWMFTSAPLIRFHDMDRESFTFSLL
jgi:hypothetical protein